MRIVSISPLMGQAFRELGHETLVLWPKGPCILNLHQELASRDFRPDLIFQEETLGPRVILSGLESFACTKIFWSLDTHLNLFWHAPYSRLFDGLMSPHISILAQAPRDIYHLPPFARLACPGLKRPWRPFAERGISVAFVGRITAHRPARKRLAEFLAKRYQAAIYEDLSHPAMLDLYQNSQLAPNESIMQEVNFRLMESASCGCLSISPEVGPDQDTLFTRGKEIEIYSNILELRDLLDYYTQKPLQAEARARLAWERVNREHLPEHRARDILAFAETLGPTAQSLSSAAENFALTLFQMNRAGRISLTDEAIEQLFDQVSAPSPGLTAARLVMLAERNLTERAARLLTELYTRPGEQPHFLVNSTASLVALKYNNWDMAKEFWYRHQRGLGSRPVAPHDPADLYRLWARGFIDQGLAASPGLGFDPTRHIASSGLDCLMCAIEINIDPDRALSLKRQGLELVSNLKGFEQMRLGYLSDLTLLRPGNWKYGLELALLNLGVFRLEEGLEEAVLAREQAKKQNARPAFEALLAKSDPDGRLAAILAGI